MAHELDVWLFADRVGTLALVGSRLNFCYGAEWLQHRHAVALSSSLPLQAEPFDDNHCRPFFAGLLPEGQMRWLIAQQFQVSRQNDFALLDRIGGECAGAVTLLEPAQPLPAPDLPDAVQWLSDAEVIALLDELPSRPLLAGKGGLRLSLAGAQSKLPVVFDGARLGLPRAGTPSSHILKPAIAGVDHSVINEGFCMALAQALQLKTAKATVHTVLNHSFLLVERYDRLADTSGQRQRLHQEDFCQALGVVPELKYQNEGGPDLAQCFALLRRVTRPHAPPILQLLDYVIFNTLIGNHDAHAKNFSLLYPQGDTGAAPVVAPLYDALCTAIYPTLTQKMAMKIGSKYKFTDVQARHWEQFADVAGLAKPQVKKRVVELAKLLPPAARKLQADAARGFVGSVMVQHIVGLIEKRCALTIRRLTDASGNNEASEEQD